MYTGKVDVVKHVSRQIGGLVQELQRAQQDFDAAAVSSRNFENQPLFRVLNLELLNHLRVTADNIAHLRWMIREASTKHSQADADILSSFHEHRGASLVEHVDAIVTAALADKPLPS